MYLTLVGGVIEGHGQNRADSTVLAQSEALKEKGKCKEAVARLTPLAERPQPSVDALLLRARCRIDFLGQTEPGMNDLFAALRIEPDNPRVRTYRGRVYNDLRMYDRALEDLNIAVAHATDTADLKKALCTRGANYNDTRRFEEAIADYERVLAIDSNDTWALNNGAMALHEVGRKEETFVYLRRYLALEPKDLPGLLNMAFFLSEEGQYQEALEWFNKAEAAGGSKNGYLLNNRGYTRFKLGDTKGALKDIEASLKVMPDNSYAYRNLALVRFSTGETAKACEACEQALRMGFTKQYGPEVKTLYDAKCR
ncbi:MAG: tetratricopeptide repeat protein [Flavobacteriales bacterium]|nr:tetratricopeptide repeat protein [Flavobacteriales bacterium]